MIAIATIGTAFADDVDRQLYTRTLTPVDNSVLFVHASGRNATAPSIPSISDTAGLTWAAVGASQTIGGLRRRLWRTTINGTSPGSITITVDWGATIEGCSMGMTSVTGCDLTAPVVTGSSTVATGTSATPASGTVPSLADANNAQLLFVGHARSSADQTAEAGWTELHDVAGSTPTQGLADFYRIASEDLTPTCTLGGSASWMAHAIEIAIASAVTVTASDDATLTESPAIALEATESIAVTSGGGVSSGSGQETCVLSEDTTTLQIAEVSPDATLSEAYTLGAALAVSDAATLAEAGAVVVGALAVTASDTGTLDESSSLSSTFPGIVVDTSGTDTGTLAEAAYVAYPVADGADSATLAESASVAVGQSTTPSDSDTGALQESSVPSATLTVVDTGAVTESGSVVVTVVADETATISDILASLLASGDVSEGWTLTEGAVAADSTLTGSVRGSVVLAPRLTGTADIDPLLAGSVLLTS